MRAKAASRRWRSARHGKDRDRKERARANGTQGWLHFVSLICPGSRELGAVRRRDRQADAERQHAGVASVLRREFHLGMAQQRIALCFLCFLWMMD